MSQDQRSGELAPLQASLLGIGIFLLGLGLGFGLLEVLGTRFGARGGPQPQFLVTLCCAGFMVVLDVLYRLYHGGIEALIPSRRGGSSRGIPVWMLALLMIGAAFFLVPV